MARARDEDGSGELVGSFELGGFVGTEDHQIVAEPMKVAVNKPLTGLATEHSQRIFGEKFEIYKRKLGSHVNPNGEMSAVKKDWKGIQKPLKVESGDFSNPRKTYSEPDVEYPSPAQPPAYNYDSRNPAESPLGQMKNHLDQVHGWVKILAIGLLAVAVIASTALGGVIFK